MIQVSTVITETNSCCRVMKGGTGWAQPNVVSPLRGAWVGDWGSHKASTQRGVLVKGEEGVSILGTRGY